MNKIVFVILFCVAVLAGAAQNATYSCDAPTGLHASDVGLDYITIVWDDDPNVNAWQVWYFPSGNYAVPIDGNVVTNSNSYTMPYSYHEEAHAGYMVVTTPLVWDFAVRASCGDSTWGPWSNILTVPTAYVGIEERLQKAVTLYPNPTASYVDVRVDGDVNATGMEVYDVYGKVVRTVVETCHGASLQTRINISDLSSGMYFIRVSTDHGPITKPFVKK